MGTQSTWGRTRAPSIHSSANMPQLKNKSARRKKFERTGGQTLRERQRNEGYRALATGVVAVPGIAVCAFGVGMFKYQTKVLPAATVAAKTVVGAAALAKPMACSVALFGVVFGGAALSKHNWTRKIRAHSRVRGLTSS